MQRAIIITDPPSADLLENSAQAVCFSALKAAIAPNLEPWLLPVDQWDNWVQSGQLQPGDRFLPFTLDLPSTFPWDKTEPQGLAYRQVYQRCVDVVGLQQQVREWGYIVDLGTLWLPLVLTAKGLLFGEVIHRINQPVTVTQPSYQQPFHLNDALRQPLYSLGRRLLDALIAPPAVYLLQFSLKDDRVGFDRLWPFPTSAAIASMNRQAPDLMACHWICLSGQPLGDIQI